MKTAKIAQVLAGMACLLSLTACEKEATLPGARFDIRTPLADSAAADAVQAAPPANAAQAISLPAAQSLAEWSQRAGNAAHSLPHGALSAQPERVWSVKIGAGNSRGARISAAPVVSGKRIFVMNTAAQVSAVSTNGVLLWQASVQPEFDAKSTASGGGLAVSGAQVFVTTGYGELIALDAASGGVIWRQRLNAAASGAPTVQGGAVYTVARDGGAAAVNTATGRIIWQIAGTPSSRGMLGAGTPAAAGNTVYLPFSGGQLQAVSPQGDTLWMGAISGKRLGRAYAGFGDITGDPVVSGGVLYVGNSAGRTIALDAQTGNRIWSAPEGALNAPLVVGGSVFVINDQSRLVRLSAATGDLIWADEMPYFTKLKPKKYKAITAHYGPVLAGGHLVVVSGDGALRLFDPASGAMTAQLDMPSGAAAPPALAAGLILVLGTNGQLHAFR